MLFAPLSIIAEHSIYIKTRNLLYMEFNQKYYNYSIKNIPIPSGNLYKKTLIEKVGLLIKRMKWKAYLLESKEKGQPNPLIFKIKSLCNLLPSDYMYIINHIHQAQGTVCFA